MTAARILLVRHGAHEVQGRVMVGRAPGIHLAPLGHRQAEALAERLARIPVRRLLVSPRERTRETAAPIAARLGLEPEILPALDEIDYGDWTGLSVEELDRIEAWRRFNHRRGTVRIPGGEWEIDVQRRIVRTILDLVDRRPEECVALISHGDVIRAALAYFLGLPLDLLHRIEVEPGSLSILRFEPAGVIVEAVNERPGSRAAP